jgi:hypothetical protein
MRRFRLPVLAGSLIALSASATLGQEVRRSKVYRVSLDQVELYLTTASAIAPSGSVSLSPGAATAAFRLAFSDLQFVSESFREDSGLVRAAAMPSRCPFGWWHLHLGNVPCPREPLAACTALCWTHDFCGATLSWRSGGGLCQDSCECYPDGTP